jgi:hypothetical protein
MKNFGTIILYLLITSVCYSQVIDNFSDGDFSSNPSWSGTSSQFVVNSSQQLQLSNNAAGSSYLSTIFNTSTLNNFEWQGYVKQTFAASGSNYSRIYLASDQANLAQPLNGYYLQFGEAGSNDALELFKQNGATSSSICRGKNAGVATSFALRFKVTRDDAGNWNLYADYSGGNNFVLEASGTESTYSSSSYFGVLCTYTASNANKFFFDDFIARPVDKTPPFVSSINVISSNTVAVTFSESVEISSAQAVSNYSADHSLTNPSSALLQQDGTTVSLTFNSNFQNGVENILTISAVKDLAGNEMIKTPLPFKYLVIDNTAPTVSGITVKSNKVLSVLFSETIDMPSAQNTFNFNVNNNLGNPASATLQTDGKTVEMVFSSSFPNGVTNEIKISGVKDEAGNEMASASFNFLFFQPNPVQRKDVIISEIFADPSPQVGLPNAEYIEIYNRSDNPIDLKNWIFTDGSSKAILPDLIFLPKQYLIITASANSKLFSGNTIGVSNFPTLNNSGDHLTLKFDSQIIDSINYTLDWYHDIDKQDGGWALELIDPENVCGEIENWTSSEDASGGTPGKQNSVFANKPDVSGPKLEVAFASSDSVLLLNFNEKLSRDLTSVSFFIEPVLTIRESNFVDGSLHQIRMLLAEKLLPRTIYQITVSNLTDCAGNFIQSEFSKLSVVLPEESDSLDIVINEVLFNPRSGGVDFVEVYNRSQKFINLKNWSVANLDSTVMNLKKISTSDLILAPQSYLAFTTNPSVLLSQYPQAAQENLFAMSLPSLPDAEGSVALVSDKGKTIDSFFYSEKMHSPFLKDNEGVSLERISFSEPSNEASNWKSAAANAGFASPGLINSNSRPQVSIQENAVSLEPEIFSPALPGRDFAKINYRFDQSGVVANIKVLDAEGRLIKTVANNETLAFEGFYRWDGDRDDGSRARTGYYIVWFEIFDASGYSQIFRKRAVIGR